MARKAARSAKVKKIADDLSRKVSGKVKAGGAGQSPTYPQANCTTQDCGGNYKCTGSNSHSCTRKFDCSGSKYSGYNGETCAGEFNCKQDYSF